MWILVVGNSSDNSGTNDKSNNTAHVAGVSGASALGLIITILGIVYVLLRRYCPKEKKDSGNCPVMLICNYKHTQTTVQVENVKHY